MMSRRMNVAVATTFMIASSCSHNSMILFSPFHTSSGHNNRESRALTTTYLDFSRVEKVSDAISFFNRMLKMKPSPTVVQLTTLLNLLVKMEDYSLALHMFDKMRHLSLPFNEYTLNIVMNCYSLLNRVDLGLSVLGIYFKSGLAPNVITFNTLIRGLLMDNKGLDAVLLFNKLSAENFCKPDEVTLTTVMNCFCLLNRVDLGFSILGIFIKSGLAPDVITFNTLIRGLFLHNKGVDAVLLFNKLSRENLCKPTEVTLTTLIDGYCLMKRVDLGFSVFCIFIKSGLPPNVITFSTLIRGLFLDNKGVDALSLFKKLSRENLCKPNEVTFGTVIDGLCRLGNVHIAVCLLDGLMKGSFKPNVQCYSPIINSLYKDGMIDNSLRLLSKMDAMGVTPDVVTYSSILQGLCDFSRWEEAKDLLNKMISRGVLPSLFTYNILLDAFAKEGNMKEAKSVLAVMMRRNVAPDIIIYSALIDGYCRRGEMEKAREIFHLILDFGLQPNIVTYSTMLHGFCQDGLLKVAMDMFAEMQKYGPQPNVITFNTIIGGLLQGGLLQEAKRMLEEMQKCGYVPDHVTYYIIVKGCVQPNELEKVQPFFEEMKSKGLSLEAGNLHMLLDHCLENSGDRVPLDMIKKLF